MDEVVNIPIRLHHDDVRREIDISGEWPQLRFAAHGKEKVTIAEAQIVKTAELAALIAGWQAKLGDMKYKVDLLVEVFREAEKLLTIMDRVENSHGGFPFVSIDVERWNLQVTIRDAYAGLGEGLKHGIR